MLTADCHVQEAENEAYMNSVIEAEQLVRESTVKQKEKQNKSIKLEDPGKQQGNILLMPVPYNNSSILFSTQDCRCKRMPVWVTQQLV